MITRLRQFHNDIAAAFRRLCRPKPTRAPRPVSPPEPRTLIFSYTHDAAADYARENGIRNWAAPRDAHDIQGYRGVRIVKLPGWRGGKLGRDEQFLMALNRLEATNDL